MNRSETEPKQIPTHVGYSFILPLAAREAHTTHAASSARFWATRAPTSQVNSHHAKPLGAHCGALSTFHNLQSALSAPSLLLPRSRSASVLCVSLSTPPVLFFALLTRRSSLVAYSALPYQQQPYERRGMLPQTKTQNANTQQLAVAAGAKRKPRLLLLLPLLYTVAAGSGRW